MFYVVWLFILAWIIWLLLADKSRWRAILPVCIFAKCLALATDVLMFYYPLWEYVGSPLLIHLADDLGIYPVVRISLFSGSRKGRCPKLYSITVLFGRLLQSLSKWFMWVPDTCVIIFGGISGIRTLPTGYYIGYFIIFTKSSNWKGCHWNKLVRISGAIFAVSIK